MRCYRRGISLLLEVLLGLGLFGLGMLMVMGLFPTTFASSAQARNLSLATNLAREVCEQVKGQGYNDALSRPWTPVTFNSEINGQTAVQQFAYDVDVTEIAGRPLKNLTVRVRWNTGGAHADGHEHSYRLQTYLAPY
jgi:type II secretory pathway pseudopilin PulG